MTKATSAERKSELYALWNAQDGLLQQYRGMGLTHQSIIAAGALLVVTLFDDKWEAYRGMFPSLAGINASLLLPFIIKTVLLFAFLYIGIRGTRAFGSMILHRAQCVNFAQNLIFMHENGTLDQYLTDDREFDAFSVLMRFAGADVSANPVGAVPAGSEKIDALVKILGVEARRDYSAHHFSRKFLNGPIFEVFNIVWYASAIYWLLFTIYMFIPA